MVNYNSAEYAALQANYENASKAYKQTQDYEVFSSVADAFRNEALIKPFAELLTNVRCGISIAPGWYPIVGDACSKIMALITANPGFRVRVEQIKEKFGGLRFYVVCYSTQAPKNEYDEPSILDSHLSLREAVYSIISEAEEKASITCETCGMPGTTKGTGWIKTSCAKH